MIFTTIEFAAFFAVVLFVYFIIPKRWQWCVLLAASWVFYGYASLVCLSFLAVTIVSTYLFARLIDGNLAVQKAWIKEKGKTVERDVKKAYKTSMEKKRKVYVGCAAIVLIGMLGVFKYSNFVFSTFSIPISLDLILPIGLSFYVFQSLGYVIDVEREMVECERNFFKHALFVSYFPQLLQGPIGSHERLAPQLFCEHRFEVRNVDAGLARIGLGVFKKLIIANYIAASINPYWAHIDQHSGVVLWFLVCVLYAVQLYADFSGYVDIACGCSRMLGIKLDENFKLPYFSKTIAEFWRNWHITLGAWFKNYVFYPLLMSGSLSSLRKRYAGNAYLANALPNVIALMVIWFLIGLWHGADWAFVAYGLFHGAFVMLAVMSQPIYDSMHSRFPMICQSRLYAVFQILRTFVIVTIGYVLFKPGNISQTYAIIRECVSGYGMSESLALVRGIPIVCLASTGALFLVEGVLYVTGGSLNRVLDRVPVLVRIACYVLLVVASAWLGYNGVDVRQFEYFKF